MKELKKGFKKTSTEKFPLVEPINYGLVNGDNAYGFKIFDSPNYSNNPYQSAEFFLFQMNLNAHEEQGALQVLKETMDENGDDSSKAVFHDYQQNDAAALLKETLGDTDAKSLKISGVVLTGTLKDVLPYLADLIMNHEI